MNILNDIYNKKLAENERKIKYLEDYIQNLKALNFKLFSNKLTVPVLVPIGNRILFRGALKHTNEITVSLGAEYFAKCSIKQADILKQHRIKDAQSKLDGFKKEKTFLENQIQYSREFIFNKAGKEIIEVQSEEEHIAWKETHRQNIKKYNQSKDKKEEVNKNDISDETLWSRLEELELQEELENELSRFSDNEDIEHKVGEHENNLKNHENESNRQYNDFTDEKMENLSAPLPSEKTHQLDLLQHVLDKQNKLEQTLTDLKNTDRSASKTESDLMSRLDELEQIDEIEDDMNRLDNLLPKDKEDEEEADNDDDNENKGNIRIKRGVTFADEDDSETLEITFKHSKMEPCKELYNVEKGIMKPSDIYTAYSHLFTETTPILRKTTYESDKRELNIDISKNEKLNVKCKNDPDTNRIIEVKDVQVRFVVNENKLDSGQPRPVSIFKKRRQQKS